MKKLQRKYIFYILTLSTTIKTVWNTKFSHPRTNFSLELLFSSEFELHFFSFCDNDEILHHANKPNTTDERLKKKKKITENRKRLDWTANNRYDVNACESEGDCRVQYFLHALLETISVDNDGATKHVCCAA